MKTLVVIIGAGEIGRAIGKILKNKKINPEFWDKNGARVKNRKSPAEIVPSADFLFLCVPSQAMREAAANVMPYLSRDTMVISLAKGIEEKTKKTMDELLKILLPRQHPFAIIGGPMLAEELALGMKGIGVVASEKNEVCENIAKLFEKTTLRIECSYEMHSVALASVLKNVYSVALGIADGLKWNGNEKGWLTSVAAKEMAEIIDALGGAREIAYGTAGLGDLIATAYSHYSRNRIVGEKLAKAGKINLESEGIISLASIISSLDGKSDKFPLLKALETILIGNRAAEIIFKKFIPQKNV